MFFSCLVFYYWLPGMLHLAFLDTKDVRISINILEIPLGHGSFILDARDHFHAFRSCFQALLGGPKSPFRLGLISSPVWEGPSEHSNQSPSRCQASHLGCGNEPLLKVGPWPRSPSPFQGALCQPLEHVRHQCLAKNLTGTLCRSWRFLSMHPLPL